MTVFDKYKLERCPYYKRNADYVKEYVPETEEPQRRELYRIAKENYDKAIYLLQKQIGIHMSKQISALNILDLALKIVKIKNMFL